MDLDKLIDGLCSLRAEVPGGQLGTLDVKFAPTDDACNIVLSDPDGEWLVEGLELVDGTVYLVPVKP